ncbi:hypothetical protein B0A55_11851 [Friedmanniomyces simplex]|uniref:Vps72/YL1 C-terminal domain-containing protein n=1 Tax=Friedmanniomyces simplex TaxID=329884 RepID=A0A4U0WS60_9PEZI|nr:hypothetical protein B0A55_11851 [Friedmanniomyces simplex]
MAPITTASNEETHQALLDTLDMQKVEKPFRNPNWKPPQRRNKNLKQILSEAQRAQQSIISTQQNSGATTPQIDEDGAAATLNPNPAQGSQDLSRLVLEKNAAASKQNGTLAVPTTAAAGPSVTYASIQAGPSTKKPKKYCDITGLPAKYTEPKTGLHFVNAEVYKIIKGLSTAQVQEYLALRNAHTVLNTKRNALERPADRQGREEPAKENYLLANIKGFQGLEKNVFDQKPFPERTRTQKGTLKEVDYTPGDSEDEGSSASPSHEESGDNVLEDEKSGDENIR